MAFRTGDPLDDFDRWDREQAEYEARLPKCEECGMPIHDEYFDVYGEILCEGCMKEKFRKDSDVYAER